MRRLLSLLSLDFVKHDRGIEGWPHGPRGVSLAGDLAGLPRVGAHSLGWKESCSLPQVSLQKRHSRAESWVQGKGKPVPSLGIGT